MAIFSGKRHQQEKEVSHWNVRVKVRGEDGKTFTAKMGYYAESAANAKEYALADFPNGTVTHISKA